MTRFRLLLAPATLALLLLASPCGDDGPQIEPEIGDGPAKDISGVWQGTYASVESERAGTFCWEFEQDGRAVDGRVVFDGGQASDAAGLVIESNVQVVWGSAAADPSASAASAAHFDSGGTLSGSATGGGATGSYNSLDADRGEWTANRNDDATCP